MRVCRISVLSPVNGAVTTGGGYVAFLQAASLRADLTVVYLNYSVSDCPPDAIVNLFIDDVRNLSERSSCLLVVR
eukprot:758768-Hanusia_phi.AAC.7